MPLTGCDISFRKGNIACREAFVGGEGAGTVRWSDGHQTKLQQVPSVNRIINGRHGRSVTRAESSELGTYTQERPDTALMPPDRRV